MALPVIHFATAALANRLVAGIPAAARAVAALLASDAELLVSRCVVAVPGGWEPTRWCREEMLRLAPHATIEFRDLADLRGLRDAALFSGPALVVRSNSAPQSASAGTAASSASDRERDEAATLERASRAIIAATGKASDGLVSRYLNRPISRLITRQLLRLPRVVPLHGTALTAAVGLTMAACLFSGSSAGLIAGALLFHAASVIDGVDGEMARATGRSSRRGATLDSLTDGFINIAFVCGLAANLWMRDDQMGAAAGAIGVCALALGLLLLAMRSRTMGEPINFDAVKNVFRARPSKPGAILARLTSRDFYAAAFALLVPLGFAQQALVVFSGAALIWLLVIGCMLLGARPEQNV